MFDTPVPLLETYLLDFAGDLYGKHMSVAFVAYLRAEAKFDSLEALQAQIAADSDAARVVLREAPVEGPPLDAPVGR